jgi:hypothetical protein
MSTEIDLEMPRSLGRIDQDDFEEIFREELEDNEYGLTSDEGFDGGWPDFENVNMTVDAVKGAKPRVTVSVTIEFPTVYPTACSDIQRREDGFVKADVVLDQAEERAYMIHIGGGTDRDEPFD